MKRFLILAWTALATWGIQAQKITFVLVDVSKSVKQADLISAKQALLEVLSGTMLSNGAYVSGGNAQDILPFKLEAGDKLSILKFGNQQTTLAIAPQPVVVNSLPPDIYNTLGSFPITPTDNNTYWKLAKAKVAEYAKNNGLKTYRLCVVSDENEDDFGPGGKPNYIDSFTLQLAEGYNTANNPAIEAPSVLVKIKTNTQGFKLNFCSNIDISKYTPPTTNLGVTKIRPAPFEPEITLLSPVKAQKGKQTELKSESVNANWSCNNCPQGIRYTCTVSGIEGTKFHETKKDLSSNTVLFKLPDGKFRITVSASNYPAGSDFTVISVSTGGFGGILALLMLLGGAGSWYYFWNKKRRSKIEVSAANKQNDMFNNDSKSGGRESAASSSNSDFF